MDRYGVFFGLNESLFYSDDFGFGCTFQVLAARTIEQEKRITNHFSNTILCLVARFTCICIYLRAYFRIVSDVVFFFISWRDCSLRLLVTIIVLTIFWNGKVYCSVIELPPLSCAKQSKNVGWAHGRKGTRNLFVRLVTFIFGGSVIMLVIKLMRSIRLVLIWETVLL